MMREKWLSTMKVLTVHTKQVLDSVSVNDGDFTVKQLEKTVNISERNELIFETWTKHTENRKSTLIFAVNVQHVIDLTDTFQRVLIHFFFSIFISKSTELMQDMLLGTLLKMKELC
jgi:ATP-dependent helicase IRC3